MKANQITPRWLTFENAADYCGLTVRTLENHAKADLFRFANVIAPGATRGRRLIDRESLDAWIESGIGVVTTATICPKRKGPQS